MSPAESAPTGASAAAAAAGRVGSGTGAVPSEPRPAAAPPASERCRPLRADAVRNRARILEAAEAVLADKGVAVPVDDVAGRACVGVGTLYRHFPTKEALLEAILVSRMERLLDDARGRAAAADPGEAFFGFLGHMVEQMTSKRDLADALARAGVDVEVASAPLRDRLVEAAGLLLRRAQDAGAVRADIDMPELFGLMAGTCMAAQRQIAGAGNPARMLEVVVDGLRAGGRPPTRG